MTTNRLAKPTISSNLTQEEVCLQGNAIIAQVGRTDVEWKVIDGRARCVWRKPASVMAREADHQRTDVMDRRGLAMSQSDTYRLNRRLEELGAVARYRPDGSRYLITDEQPVDRKTRAAGG